MATVMGMESEYSVSAISADQDLSDEEFAGSLFRIAAETLPHLPSNQGSRLFLESGGCFYLDYGDHAEYATGECANPWDLVRHVRAGDRILANLAGVLSRRIHAEVIVTRGNVGHSRQTWGSHESYLSHWSPERLVDGLLPFLCSRIVYSGSGGFDPFNEGIAFCLSPRAVFLSEASSGESTTSRGIVHLKTEPLTSLDLNRLHLICGDALGSEVGNWLRMGATALVVCLLEQNYVPPADICPAGPVTAIKQFSSDHTLTARVKTGRAGTASALDIQWSYLQAIEDRLDSHYPDWAPKVLEGWRSMLEILEENNDVEASGLDWAIKQRLYRDICEQTGFAWESLPNWNRVIGLLPSRRRPSSVNKDVREQALACNVDVERVDEFFELRNQLFELETRYLQVGDGVFELLDCGGALSHASVVSRESIDQAMSAPPIGTRAQARGECVGRHHNSISVTCGWSRITDVRNKRMLDLDDPLNASKDWEPFRPDSEDASPIHLRSTALACYSRGDYAQARAYLECLVETGYERSSTHCHLARIAIMCDETEEAMRQIETAWLMRNDAPRYIVARTVWLQVAAVMLGISDQALTPLLGKLKTLVTHTEPYEWTMQPVLAHIHGRMSDSRHSLLTTLAGVLSGNSDRVDLEVYNEWQEAFPEPLD